MGEAESEEGRTVVALWLSVCTCIRAFVLCTLVRVCVYVPLCMYMCVGMYVLCRCLIYMCTCIYFSPCIYHDKYRN